MLLLLNVVLFVFIPAILLRYVAILVPPGSIPFSLTLIYAFGAVITGLQVLSALTEGMGVSAAFESGSFLATAAYIWVVVDGGTLALSAGGLRFVLSFQPLLFLAVLPPLYGALRAPLSYLLDLHEASNPSPDTV